MGAPKTSRPLRYFLSITAGPTPREVEPVVCTEDRGVIDAALRAIELRLGRGTEPAPASRAAIAEDSR
jgi:hypothetical protein